MQDITDVQEFWQNIILSLMPRLLDRSSHVPCCHCNSHGRKTPGTCTKPLSRRPVVKAAANDNHQTPVETRHVSRREMVLHSIGILPATVIGGMLIGTDDPTTILNSVLSGYGLPMLKSNDTFRVYDEFENDWVLSYPRSWVARPNTLRQGFYVSNFQTADKATVESFTVTSDLTSGSPEANQELVRRAVAAAVVPGAGQGQADDKLTLPAPRLVKTEEQTIDGVRYIYMTFPSETLTRSGYAIKRKHWGVVAVRKGIAYTLSASARSDQYNKDKEVILRAIVESFRLR